MGLDLAVKHGCASLCVASGNLDAVRTLAPPDLTLCSVIGFPHGNMPWRIKEWEAQWAIDSGATELDVVLNIREWWENQSDCLQNLRHFRRMYEHKILKLILETCYLDEDDITRLSWNAGFLGWDYVKTSTGFGPRGASLADVHYMKHGVSAFPQTQIKASGGIKTKAAVEEYIREGCKRIGVGVSSFINILQEYNHE
jgi:deoxyribose-phosphate aldolase